MFTATSNAATRILRVFTASMVLIIVGAISISMVGIGAAYFLQAPGPAQVIPDGTPVTYLNIGEYKVPRGATFNFSTWTRTGGVAYPLNVNNGVVTSSQPGENIY